MKKVVIATDSYKGCLSSAQAGAAAASAVRAVIPGCKVTVLPVADGGEGTVDALVDALGGHKAQALVSDPLGRKVLAEYGVAGDLAIIESAAACGLALLSPEERNPLVASTKGLGELILAAADAGCRRFIVGLGGSATVDGGMGMISVDGFLRKTAGLEFTVACDVDTPFVGPDGAAHVFGPQKFGAAASENTSLPKDVADGVEELERRMLLNAERILAETGVDVRSIPGAGAAGGLGGAFRAYLGAELKKGVDMVLDIIGFDKALKGADLVITGEGCSDFQTLKGKTPAGVLSRASAKGIPVALLSGAVRDMPLLKAAGFAAIVPVTPVPEDAGNASAYLAEAMLPAVAKANIRNAVGVLLRKTSIFE